MKSKIALFVAAATLSLSASAALVQYDFSGTFNDGGTIGGFFVQDTTDKSVAFFNFGIAGGKLFAQSFFPSGVMTNISGAHTYFSGAGPTSFSVFNDQDTLVHHVALEFLSSSTPGVYRLDGENYETPMIAPDGSFHYRTVASGFATEGILSDNLRAFLEQGPADGINHVVPDLRQEPQVPEPGSLALLWAGAAALGAASLRRRAASARVAA